MGAEPATRPAGSAWAPGLLALAATGLLVATSARSQEADSGEVRDTAAITIEDQGVEAVLRRVAARQDILEEALRTLEGRLAEVAAMADTTAARVARGEDPLVSLEIEQLWAMIGSLERDNAIMREQLDALAAAPAEAQVPGE